MCLNILHALADLLQTTAGKADRPALKADGLAAQNTGVPNSAG